MALLVFKTSVGLNKAPGGFDSHPPPPISPTRSFRMFKRVSQPPVNPATRDVEHHDFWPGFVAVVAGGALTLCGARHLTSVDTAAGDTASEIQLIKAFSSSGLQYADQLAPPPPPKLEDAAAEAEALDRWAKQQANATPPTWKVRVDTAAAAPCPT